MSRILSTSTVSPPSSVPPPPPAEAAIEHRLGWVLRGGVAAAAAIVLFGLMLFFVREIGHDRITLDAALGRGETTQPVRTRAILDGVIAGEATTFIQIGLLVLILTPIARVAMTVWLFRRQRDRVFTTLAAAVLVVLILGFFGIGA